LITTRAEIIIKNCLRKTTGLILFRYLLKGENMNRTGISHATCLISLYIGILIPCQVHASSFKVLVIMSYDDHYAWSREIKEGVDSVLAETCIVKYLWLDTKRDLEGGEERAKEAAEFYHKFQPDGVIAADDNAQSMFVVPYLKDKVTTPVMFCGVNGELEDYGYPASNVSGILERLHIRNSIAFAQLLLPSMKKVIFMTRESPSGRAVFKQYEREHNTYPVESLAFILPKTLNSALSALKEFKESSDALFIETMEGIKDETGRLFSDEEVIPILARAFGKPLISNNLNHVESGTLCAVVKTGQEQGATASEMLLKAMQGTPVSQIPVTHNRNGKRVINLRVMKKMGIKPGSEALKGVQLVGTRQ